MNRLQIRELAEKLSDTDGHDYPSVAFKDAIVLEESRRLYAEAVNLPTYPAKRSTVTVVANGSASYVLPSGIHRVTRVQYTQTSGSCPLRRASDSDRADTDYAGLVRYPEPTWDIEQDPTSGLTFRLYPASTTGVSVVVEYLPSYAGLTSDSAEFYMPDPCASLVATRAAIRFIEKSDKDPAKVSFLRRDEQVLVEEVSVSLGALGGSLPLDNSQEWGYA